MPPLRAAYTPPLAAVGTIQFRLHGPSHPLYRATTPKGPRLYYWNAKAGAHIPVYPGTSRIVHLTVEA